MISEPEMTGEPGPMETREVVVDLARGLAERRRPRKPP